MAELIMRKRRAQPGEIGLFPAGEVFEEAWGTVKLDVDVDVKATTAAHAKYNRLSWRIANLMLASSDQWEYSDEARDWLLVEAKHSRKVMDKLRGKAELKPKGTRRLDGTAWLELIPRLVHVATTKLGIPEDSIFTELSREEFFRRDDPPPVTEIPDGPGNAMGHNSGPAGVSQDLPDITPEREEATRRPAVPAGELSEPGPSGRAVRGEAAGRPLEPKPPPVPTSARHYPDYARWHMKRATAHEEAMAWLWTPAEAKLRDSLLVPIGVRKSLEREAAAQFGWKS